MSSFAAPYAISDAICISFNVPALYIMPFITSTATVFALTVFSTISCFAAAIYVTAAKTDGYINTASRVIINDAINLLILVVSSFLTGINTFARFSFFIKKKLIKLIIP